MMSHLLCKPSNCQSPIQDDHHAKIIIIIIAMMIFALGLICAVSAGGRTRSHLDWLKTSSRPKSRTHFAFCSLRKLYFVFSAYCILCFGFRFAIKHFEKVSYFCLCNETFCAHKCIFSAQDCNSSADITKGRSSSRKSFVFFSDSILYFSWNLFCIFLANIFSLKAEIFWAKKLTVQTAPIWWEDALNFDFNWGQKLFLISCSKADIC